MRISRILSALTVGGGGLILYNIQNKNYPQFQKPEFKDVISKEPYSSQIFLHLPLNALSHLWGKLSQVTLPTFSRPFLFGIYIKKYNCNMEEAEVEDLKFYETFGEFFRRSIKSKARPISSSLLVSPCDGTILSLGLITENKVEHVKTKTYSLNYFLGPITWKSVDHYLPSSHDSKIWHDELSVSEAHLMSYNSDSEYCSLLKIKPESHLHHCTIYLAPGDYHRFHSPANWMCKFRRYFPGYLLSVSPKMANRIPELMNINERVVYIGSWEHGFFSMTAVGATNVGSIKIYKDPTLMTNQRTKLPPMVDLNLLTHPDTGTHLQTPITMEKGDAFGEFNLGSTIVLIFEAPKNFRFSVEPGKRIKFGDSIGN